MPGHGVPPDDPALSERLTVMVALWPERPGRDGIHGAQSLPPESSVAKWPCLLLGGEYGERKTMVKPQQHTGRPGTLIKPAWLAGLHGPQLQSTSYSNMFWLRRSNTSQLGLTAGIPQAGKLGYLGTAR
eukprot:gnl/TRDRNA2_/TRDRNA2_173214_c2_seq2.p1 gnl/TRDRNA2_/TRDRNA2_173214_c2~~gnl/TRDRNA2_/TRDRNA2_173214_c2_seq2.p1  ORF type:complete len:129 (-),score=12.26 gnl/TRDRNA2_/TRDRNA2_173214_c2_seq2:167-553(-)